MAASAGSVTRDLAGRRIRSQQGEEERAETASGHVQYHQRRVAAASVPASAAPAPASAAANLISFEIYDFELFGQGCLSQSQSQSVWVALNYFVCLKFLRFFDELTLLLPLLLPQRVAQCGRCCSCSSNSCCCCCCCWLNLICVFAKALTFLCCPLITHSQSPSCSVRIYS